MKPLLQQGLRRHSTTCGATCTSSQAVPLILQAIGHIAFVLTGTTDGEETASILNNFFGQENTRISYQNA